MVFALSIFGAGLIGAQETVLDQAADLAGNEFIGVTEEALVSSGDGAGQSEEASAGLSEEDAARLEKLLKKNLTKNAEEITALTENLDRETREGLYEKYKLSQGKAIGLNWAGFGAGSFAQYDPLGGTICAVSETVGIVAFGGGTLFFLGGILFLPLMSLSDENNGTHNADIYVGCTLGAAAGGIVLWLGSKIFGSIRPVFWTKSRNAQMKELFGLSEDVESVALVPYLDPVGNQYGLVASLRF